jgi:hypothetical protein
MATALVTSMEATPLHDTGIAEKLLTFCKTTITHSLKQVVNS